MPAVFPTMQAEEYRSLRQSSPEVLRSMQAMAGICHSILDAGEPEDILARTLDVACDLLAADRGFALLDEGDPDLRLMVTRGATPHDAEEQEAWLGSMGVEEILREGHTILRRGLDGEGASHDTPSLLCVPIPGTVGCVGLIGVESRSPGQGLAASDAGWLEILAHSCGNAIRRAHHLSQVIQVEKSRALHTLAVGLSQGLETPLETAGSQCARAQEALSMSPPDIPGLQAAVDDLQDNLIRCGLLVHIYLGFNRSDGTDRGPTCLGTVVGKAVDQARRGWSGPAIDVQLDVCQPLPLVHLNEELWTHAMLRILNNARLALEGRDGALLAVQVRREDGHVLISVSDNGIGIEPALQRRVFDPYFTTRPPGKGTGLGLAIAHAIVSSHGGQMRLVSRPQKGTRFVIALPIATSQSA